MIRHLLFLLFLLTTPTVRADGNKGALPRFQQITEADGLSSNTIRHVLQVPDGRMVVTTWECFNVLSGKDVQQFNLTDVPSHPLSNYHGSYHVYADNESRLWLKDNGCVWCLNLQTGQPEDLSDWQMDDFFVDGLGRAWTVQDTLLNNTISFEREWGELQDMDADSLRMYLFFSSSTWKDIPV